MTPASFDDLLSGTFPSVGRITEDLGSSGRDDNFGHGLINANLAVLAAEEAAGGGSTPDAPALSLSSRNLDFGSDLSQLALRISNAGSGTLSVASITPSESWLTVSPGALGSNTVSVDRTGLTAGIHTADIDVSTNGGDATLRVRLSVGASPVAGGDVGVIYVLLLDAGTFDTIAQVITSADEDYAFSFPDVAPGQYRVVAGTDLDDNGLIDDDGEAFGGFPVSSDPSMIDVTEDRDDLDFAMQFQLNLGAAITGPTRRGRFRRLF
jgi:serine protease